MADTSTVPQGASSAGTAGLGLTLSHYFVRDVLDYIKLNTPWAQFGLMENVPLREGKNCIWTRFDAPATTAPTPITEGQTPASTAMSARQVTATLAEYFEWTEKSGFVIKTSFVDQIPYAVDWLKYRGAVMMDLLCRAELTSNAVTGSSGNVRVAGSLTATAYSSIASSSVLTAKDFLLAQTILGNNGVPPFHADGSFGAVIPTVCQYDIMADTADGGWIDVRKYTDNRDILTGELGKTYNVRLVQTPLGATLSSASTSASATGYLSFVFGKSSFGKSFLGGGNTQLIVRPPKPDSADPGGQRGSVGVYFAFAAKYLYISALTTDKHRTIAIGSSAGVSV